ncbi:biopolymer transport protein [Thiorhodovibrio frisius]|uniref:Biopolymer transport protein n=1 Tax=Thiorhodovibrio frisius TaxID=631362 RepID=H8Z8K4_9GAMM|nr:biopolymer transport protein [Thiorhodovibrio frisius]WPL22289.1 Biopolymer transport protein ExbB [Thiorhodovibrio frisius]
MTDTTAQAAPSALAPTANGMRAEPAAGASSAPAASPKSEVLPEPFAETAAGPQLESPTDALPADLATSTAVPPSLPAPNTGTESAALSIPDDGVSNLVELLRWLSDGGPVLMIIAALSVVALTLVLIKAWQFHRLRLDAREPVARALALWARDEPAGAMAALAGSCQPVARLLHRALRGYLLPGIDAELLREELARLASAELERLRSYLRALETIATLSPLLGLLGTVLGMIEAFRQLEQAGAQVNPALLSGGIWQALLTTAAGLGVAIPVVFAHAWLEQRVEGCGHRMEDAVTQVFTRDLMTARNQVAQSAADAVHQGATPITEAAFQSTSAPSAQRGSDAA